MGPVTEASPRERGGRRVDVRRGVPAGVPTRLDASRRIGQTTTAQVRVLPGARRRPPATGPRRSELTIPAHRDEVLVEAEITDGRGISFARGCRATRVGEGSKVHSAGDWEARAATLARRPAV